MNEDTNSNTTSTEPSDIKSQVLAFRDNAHAANVKKLKAGIKCIFTVPACFLILLFLTGSSKIIFLVLWIASLFIIAAYLIHVEYSDYKVQEMVNSLQDTEDNILPGMVQRVKLVVEADGLALVGQLHIVLCHVRFQCIHIEQ